jgi:hypothetical protein
MNPALAPRWIVRFAACALGLAAAAAPSDPPADAGWQPLFNGKDLAGWTGDAALWRVEDGVVIGRADKLKRNSYLVSEARYADFELELDVKLAGANANSGVQYRSAIDPKKPDPVGYQADMGQTYWGSIYVTDKRFGLLAGARPEVWKAALKPDDWNRYVVRVEGDRHRIQINGVTTVEAQDGAHRDGILAIQLHVNATMEVRIRNARIRKL